MYVNFETQTGTQTRQIKLEASASPEEYRDKACIPSIIFR